MNSGAQTWAQSGALAQSLQQGAEGVGVPASACSH